MTSTSKRKRDSDDVGALTTEQIQDAKSLFQNVFNQMDPETARHLEQAHQIIDTTLQSMLPPHLRPVKTCRATELKTVGDVATEFDLITDHQRPFPFELKSEHASNALALSDHVEGTVNMLLNSPINNSQDKPSVRAIVHIVLLDRMSHLADVQAFSKIKLDTEVAISARTTSQDTPTLVQGRADWVLAYGKRQEIDAILTVVEAKGKNGVFVGLPQLLVYMVGVWEKRFGRNNRSCFGICCDGIFWRFAFLSSNKKVCVSDPINWTKKKSKVIAYLDTILSNAIECSPSTTSTKAHNTAIRNYDRVIQEKWDLGKEEDEDEGDEGEDGAAADNESERPMDIVKRADGKIVMRTSRPT